eukprot:2663294-Pleurochrysis_carterae.AAC.1
MRAQSLRSCMHALRGTHALSLPTLACVCALAHSSPRTRRCVRPNTLAQTRIHALEFTHADLRASMGANV